MESCIFEKHLLNFHMWTLYSFSKSLKIVNLNSAHFKLTTKFYFKNEHKIPNFDTRHTHASGYVVAKLRERLAVRKQGAQKFEGERFNLGS